MFFILSGFLITWILAVEAEASGTVSLGRFYRARTLRLLPAYLSTIALVLAGSHLFGIAQGNQSYRLADLWPLFLSYTLNIWMAATAIWPWGVSHFWSLCVEEHFYLSWSAVMKRWGVRHRPAHIAGGDPDGRSVSNRMVPVDEPRPSRRRPRGRPFFRIYYATDTRIDAILVGCALALAVRESRLQNASGAGWSPPRWFPSLALLATLGTIAWVTQYRWRIETFGYTVMAIASSTLLLAIFLQPQCWIARLLATRPLVHLGRISYGVYLIHAPLLAGLEVKLRFSAQYIEPARYLPVLGLLTVGSVGAAALHYRSVERRFLALRGPRPFLTNSRAAPPAPNLTNEPPDNTALKRDRRAGLEKCAISE